MDSVYAEEMDVNQDEVQSTFIHDLRFSRFPGFPRRFKEAFLLFP
jgi:hypothetical protein